MVFVRDPGRSDTIIIGGGPAGLSCAIQCSLPGRRTLVLEKTEACGKKLLITGSGQCNLTHAGDIRDFPRHYGVNGKFLKPALSAWTNRDLCSFFATYGVPLETEADGKVFPRSRRSRDVLHVLLQACREKGTEIRCGEPVSSVNREKEVFRVDTSQGRYYSHHLVIATGGASYPATGSSGDGYRFAASLTHTLVPPAPALTPVYIDPFPLADLAGISFPGMVFTIWRENRKVAGCRGDVLITHTGLSGPGILDNSRSMLAGDEIRLSFVGGVPPDTCAREIVSGIPGQGFRNVASLLARYRIPSRVLDRLLELSGIDPHLSCAHLPAEKRKRIVASLTAFPLTISGLGDFTTAMVTRGGVALHDITARTMESRHMNNLFFAGEVLDIDGDTGGYNLQAAFSTGWLAGTSIRNRLLPP
ncbi:MAG TPA: NAD(P)/FAD-dependent oxidoreductase [Methanoregulaceae archaeon]|nr:NAD(P)/FAD-dependent oxidoreductase [Methanoregulaceae archaeon]